MSSKPHTVSKRDVVTRRSYPEIGDIWYNADGDRQAYIIDRDPDGRFVMMNENGKRSRCSLATLQDKWLPGPREDHTEALEAARERHRKWLKRKHNIG